MFVHFDYATLVRLQPVPGRSIPLWPILLLLASAIIVVLIFLIMQTREKWTILAERDSLQDEKHKLWRLSEAIDWSLPIEKSLLNAIKTIKEIAGAHRVFIHLFDVRHEFLYAIVDPDDSDIFNEMKLVSRSIGRLPALFENLKPIIVEDLLHPNPEDIVLSAFLDDGNLAVTAIPLYFENDILGAIYLFFNHHLESTDANIEFFSLIGRSVGRSIKFTKSSENLRELAILQERKHLSQELHDNFSQLISALRMRAEAALYSEDKQASIDADLNGIIDTAHEIQVLLRDEMVALHSSVNENEDLLPAIRDSIQRFEQVSNIPVMVDDETVLESVIVSTRIGIQFIRILQEGLSNVRRHSKATQAVIRIEQCGQRLCLEIEDNGQGFDIQSVHEDRLGLKIMEERAHEVGGSVTIRSTTGSGTCIRVELPESQIIFSKNDTSTNQDTNNG